VSYVHPVCHVTITHTRKQALICGASRQPAGAPPPPRRRRNPRPETLANLRLGLEFRVRVRIRVKVGELYPGGRGGGSVVISRNPNLLLFVSSACVIGFILSGGECVNTDTDRFNTNLAVTH